MHWLASRTDRLVGIEGKSAEDMVLIEERIAALKPRLIWLYLLISVYLVGVEISLRATGIQTWNAVPIAVILVTRLTYWIRNRKTDFRGEHARTALRHVAFGAFGVGFGYLFLMSAGKNQADAATWQMLLMSGAVCGIAAAQTLSAFPAGARIILIVLGLPTAIAAMLFTTNLIATMVASNLALCAGASLYLLTIQDQSFRRHILLRFRGDADRVRAERAERTALTERAQARAAAESDFLTGLPNRRAFLAAIGERKRSGQPDTLMILDLDGFKPVNDTFGHLVGDELLKQVSNRLIRLCHAETLVARLGGDEFALLLRGVGGDDARTFADQTIEALGEPYTIGTSKIGIAVCCGMAMLSGESIDPSAAIREADLALYRAKASGRGQVACYDRGLGEAVERRSAIELALREPGVENEIELAFQPIYDLETMRIASFEALARWSHSTLGPVSPSDFIPITEQIQLVERLSCALLSRAIDHAACWPGGQRLSFNLSAVQLCSIGSAARVLDIVAATDFAPGRLQIEVTETAMMGDLAVARSNLEQLRAAGVEVVLDDFGAGFASIGYLREMQFDGLKLDGSLLAACETSKGTALLKGVISLARAIGTPCIAEHVETMQQATLLRILGCRFGQGYWLGKPVAASEAESLSRAELLQGPNLRLAG